MFNKRKCLAALLAAIMLCGQAVAEADIQAVGQTEEEQQEAVITIPAAEAKEAEASEAVAVTLDTKDDGGSESAVSTASESTADYQENSGDTQNDEDAGSGEKSDAASNGGNEAGEVNGDGDTTETEGTGDNDRTGEDSQSTSEAIDNTVTDEDPSANETAEDTTTQENAGAATETENTQSTADTEGTENSGNTESVQTEQTENTENTENTTEETDAGTEEEEPQTEQLTLQAKGISLESVTPDDGTGTGVISGTVDCTSANVKVTLYRKGTQRGSKICTTSDTSYTFSGLEAGDYSITFVYVDDEGTEISYPMTFYETVTQADPEKDSIVITGVTISGNKVVIAGKAASNETITAGADTASSSASGISGTSGSYEITVTCSGGRCSQVWAQYGSDSSTRVYYTVSEEKYPTLRWGDRGGYVYQLQQRLKELGYYTIRVDGIYGSGTQRAVRLFQQVNGLSGTGVADSATQQLLYSSAAKRYDWDDDPSEYYTLRRSAYYQSAVVPLQRRLKNLGYYSGSCDGYYGSGTYRAVRNFQSRNGLYVTGTADPETQRVLYSSSARAAGSSSGDSTGYRLLYWGCKGSAVTRLQRALLNAGYTQVRSVDGIYGKWTYDAVRAFQRDHGLSVDGIAGKKTQNLLYGTSY